MEPINPADKLPIDTLSGHEPSKLVKSNADMDAWLRSEAYYNIVGFINGISTAIQGKRLSHDCYISPVMENLLAIFDKLNDLVDQTPPVQQPQRFGNKSFRDWCRKMNHSIFHMVKSALPQEKCHLFNELGYYIAESFGNSVRIDYGTGHELSFIFFLCGLYKAEILNEEDNDATALKLFNKYLIFVRRLQKTYNTEPAGSQGVWSLDDFQFIPFIWGSAQLSYHSPFDPAKFLDENIINDYKDEYMFISCIDYICQVKTGHFAEHSNQLWSISAVPAWSKINSGLVKMYQKEILAKYPIIQHVLFGQLLSFKPVRPGTTIRAARLGHVNVPLKGLPSTSTMLSRFDMPPPGVSVNDIDTLSEADVSKRSSVSSRVAGADQSDASKRSTASKVPTEGSKVSKVSTEPSRAPTEYSRAPTDVSKASTEVSKAPTEVSKAPTEVSKAPTEVSKAPTEVSKAPTEVSKTPTEVSKAPTEVSKVATETPTEGSKMTTENTRVEGSVVSKPETVDVDAFAHSMAVERAAGESI